MILNEQCPLCDELNDLNSKFITKELERWPSGFKSIHTKIKLRLARRQYEDL